MYIDDFHLFTFSQKMTGPKQYQRQNKWGFCLKTLFGALNCFWDKFWRKKSQDLKHIAIYSYLNLKEEANTIIVPRFH